MIASVRVCEEWVAYNCRYPQCYVMLCSYARFAKKIKYSSQLILSLALASAYYTYKELKLFESSDQAAICAK